MQVFKRPRPLGMPKCIGHLFGTFHSRAPVSNLTDVKRTMPAKHKRRIKPTRTAVGIFGRRNQPGRIC